MYKTILSILLLSSLSLAVGSVLKTGQTKSYDADGNVVTDGSVKDDGYYQTGKARSYNRSSTGVVKDNATGLEWQDNVDSVSKPWLTQDNYDKCTGNNGQTQDTSKCTDTSGDTAATYCSNLTLDGGGWRLPSTKELETLVDDSHYYPSVTSGIFQHISSDYYWSSTTNTNVYAAGSAWFVAFGAGNSYYDDKTNDNYVRCVRGGSN